MKKILISLMICALFLIGCSEETSTENDYIDKASTEEISSEETSAEELLAEDYNIGDEVDLGGEKFNIYRIGSNDNILYLMAQRNIATTTFSDADREQKYMHDYEGSLVEGYVNEFVDGLEDKGLVIKDSGIIGKDDLLELGFETDGLNGTQYKISDAPEFVEYEEKYWLTGYSKYDTYAWTYNSGTVTTDECEKEYGLDQ